MAATATEPLAGPRGESRMVPQRKGHGQADGLGDPNRARSSQPAAAARRPGACPRRTGGDHIGDEDEAAASVSTLLGRAAAGGQ